MRFILKYFTASKLAHEWNNVSQLYTFMNGTKQIQLQQLQQIHNLTCDKMA